VEVNIDDDDASKIMQESFFGDKLGKNEPCWGNKNQNRISDSSTEVIVNEPKYDPVYDLIPKGGKQKVYNVMKARVQRYSSVRES